MKEVLERIATALEALVTIERDRADVSKKRSEAGKKGAAAVKRSAQGTFVAVDQPANTGKTPAKPSIAPFIATYIKAWQGRHGTKARPDLGGVSQGILNRLCRDLPGDQLHLMLQAYCQMEDKWFVEKRHDLATFEKNINKVALALDKGHEQTNVNWEKVFGGNDYGQAKLFETTGPDTEDVGRKELPTGKDLNILEGLSERIRR